MKWMLSLLYDLITRLTDTIKNSIKVSGELLKLPQLLEDTIMKISDLTELLINIRAQLSKAKDEIIGRITELETSLENVELSPEAQEALSALVDTAQALDDIIPDVVPVEEPPVEPEVIVTPE